jgi:hypothetical protein
MLATARAAAEQRFTAQTTGYLTAEAIERLSELATGGGLLAELKADPGPLGLETLLGEVDKRWTSCRVRVTGLPPALFADVSEKLLAAWRARAATQYPSDLQIMAEPVRLTLLVALCWVRTAEIPTAWSTC